ncbi:MULTISPECIES: hypothetical protein [Pseudomonas]|uniref:Uncharacterized protein n=1 Tax=Pseudomonas oryzihabitans TaxID=47885 RepID=A0A178LAH1_9PSED|nr:MULTISPECIES: hypothetical protein [Pseudomonas]KXJ31563.1 hypothetical protein AX284_02965 [Pseudomonas sp. HUK17]OAN26607.1 hypothetical protein A4V15_05470 [Pseudomonas oryzihabitans]SEO82236.1 hypothetical protein SAMN02787149_1028 [Pseudomonas sp. Snoq117.2]
MTSQFWTAVDDLRPAVALVILHGDLEPAVTAELRSGLPGCSDLPVLQLEDVGGLHDEWLTQGPHSRIVRLLSRLGGDCLLLAVEPAGSKELEWLGSVAGQRLQQFTSGTPTGELIARLQQLRREQLLAVLPL